MAKRTRKPKEHEVAIRDLLDYSEVSSLAEEMRSWHDNEEGTSLENTQRHEAVGEAADSLEEIASELEQAIDGLFGLEEDHPLLKTILDEKVKVAIGRTTSRSWRAGTAAGDLHFAVERIQEYLDVVDPTKEQVALKDAASEYLDGVEEQAEALEMVEFPGMFR